MARVCKLFGVTPSYYLLSEDGYARFSIDLAVAMAYLEDENHRIRQAKEQNALETSAIAKQLEADREQLLDRG